MANTIFKSAGATNVSVPMYIFDDTAGTPETGVTSATSGLALYYWRPGAARVAITGITDLALQTTAHTDGGILHIGDGHYRVDFQDAAFASGVDFVLLEGTATGMIVKPVIVMLNIADTPANFSDLSITSSTGRIDVGSWLGTAVTTSSTSAKPEVDVSSISDDATAANNLELITELNRGVTINATGGTTGSDADDLVDSIWDEAQSAHTSPGTFGEHLDGIISSIPTAAQNAAQVRAEFTIPKNTAIADFVFPMFDANGDTVTGETVTGQNIGDAETTFTNLANNATISEIGTTGYYTIDLTAADLNYDQVLLKFTSTNAKPTVFKIFPTTA